MVDRINLILKAKNITAKQFAEEIGIQPSGMSHILSGRNRPSLDFVIKVVNRYPEIDIKWLTLGEGEMYASSSVGALAPPVGLPPAPPVGLPPASPVGLPPAPPVTAPPAFESIVDVPTPSVPISSVPAAEPDLFSGLEEDPVAMPSVEQPPVSVVAANQTAAGSDSFAGRVPTEKNGPLDFQARQLDENRTDAPTSGSSPTGTILAKKRIMKVVILYDDHSFSEYYPE